MFLLARGRGHSRKASHHSRSPWRCLKEVDDLDLADSEEQTLRSPSGVEAERPRSCGQPRLLKYLFELYTFRDHPAFVFHLISTLGTLIPCGWPTTTCPFWEQLTTGHSPRAAAGSLEKMVTNLIVAIQSQQPFRGVKAKSFNPLLEQSRTLPHHQGLKPVR